MGIEYRNYPPCELAWQILYDPDSPTSAFELRRWLLRHRALPMLLPLLTLPRLASIFTDCSVTDPYACVARPGCGW